MDDAEWQRFEDDNAAWEKEAAVRARALHILLAAGVAIGGLCWGLTLWPLFDSGAL